MLERHLEIAIDGEERKALAKRIALLHQDALDQSAQAVRAWETVLEIDPNDGEALEALAQLHLGAGAFRELTDIYARKIELTDRADERRMLFMQSARIFEEKLNDPDRAVEQLRAVLNETPGDGEALEDLDRVLTAEGRHADLVEVIDQRVSRAQDAGTRDELAFRAARLTEVGARRRRGGDRAVRPDPADVPRSRRRAGRVDGDRARRRLSVARRRGPRADCPGGRRVGRRRRAAGVAAGRRGRGSGAPRAAVRNRAHRGGRAARREGRLRRLGARADRGCRPTTRLASRSSGWRRRTATGDGWPTSTPNAWRRPSTRPCSGRWRCGWRR